MNLQTITTFIDSYALVPVGIAFFIAIIAAAIRAMQGDSKAPIFVSTNGASRRIKALEDSITELQRQIEVATLKSNSDRALTPEEVVALKSSQPSVNGPPPRSGPSAQTISLLSRRERPVLIDAARDLLIASLKKTNLDIDIDKASQIYQSITEQQNRGNDRTNLRTVTVAQLESTASTKTSMISLFVMFNLGVIAAFIFSPSTVTAGKELILGLYISLATFIVYVYRAANARALVLLAISEDLKRHHDAEKYLGQLRPKSPLSDRDIEILKLILTNRSEREKNNEHPYELVLKGITNSTILLKGGKVQPMQNNKKDKTEKDNS